jgi:hypothetical protein
MTFIGKGAKFISPAGTGWVVIQRWTRGWGGTVWYKMMSEGGRVRNMLPYEFEDWERID